MKASVQKTIARITHRHNDGAISRTVMEIPASGDILLLRGRQYARLHDATGWTIRALGGAVWITQDGDLRDVVLEAGDSFTPDRAGVLMSPIGEARVCIARSTGCSAVARGVPAPVTASRGPRVAMA